MTLAHLTYTGYIGFVSLVATVFAVLEAIVLLVQSIRRAPQDRVLRFEALAFVTFFLGLPLLKVSGFWLPVVLFWLILFFGLTGCAAYFGMSTWLLRKKQRRDVASF